MAESLAGEVLDSRWQLQERIGTGSYAHVYRARDRDTGVERAVKVLTEQASAEAVHRFRSEFLTMSRIRHPHVVSVHAVGTVGGRPYMVLDLHPRGNVLTLLDENGPLTLEDACEVGVQVLSGLAEAHARGVIHRDVKPGNVLVDDQGRVRLCDFGIARIEQGAQQLTQVGTSLGTLLYMPPEQRVDAHKVDLTVDIYGTGGLLYRLLTDESPSELYAAGPDSDRWAGVPDRLRPILVRATRADPADRYRDARAMAKDLYALLPADRRARLGRSGDPSTFPAPAVVGKKDVETTQTAPAPHARAPGISLLGVAGAVAAGVLIAVGVWWATLRP